MKLFNLHKPTIIFSVDRRRATLRENAAARADAVRTLEVADVPFKQVKGSFDGRIEHAFVINAEDSKTILPLVTEYQQENILYLDEYRKAYLIQDPAVVRVYKYLGQWQAVGKPKAGEDYTYDPANRTHYVVR